jgi:hypothetical protein
MTGQLRSQDEPKIRHGSATSSGAGAASPRGRRAVMLGAAAAGVGAAASLAGRAAPASAAAVSAAKPVLLGKANTERTTTTISNAKGTALSATTTSNGHAAVTGADTSTAGGYGVHGTSANGTAIRGTTTNGIGVWGTSTNSTGIYGTTTHGTGVYGSSTTSTGVYGTTEGNDNAGVYGADASTGGGTGVYGTSTSGDGVSGSSTSGDGVSGTTSGDGQSGVAGTDASTGSGYGVHGTSPRGLAVYGLSTTGYGVAGVSTNGTGVSGYTEGNGDYGVWGRDGSPDGGYGVYASSGHGTALYADGNATVTGSLSKGGGSFKIDHPLDPARKYLSHSFVESPDMKNIYDGTIVLDRDGRAVVGLPDWFEALNRDYRYQLTAISGPAPDLHIAAEISGGHFTIAGGAAGQKVCWQVTGTRQDAWANANRIPVEENKPAEDQGRYLHPELHRDGEPITSIARARAERHRKPSTARPAAGPRP